MTTLEVKLDLPDNLAKAAKDAGLLTPQALEGLLWDAVRRKATDELFEMRSLRARWARAPN
jgi:hypothetical protein